MPANNVRVVARFRPLNKKELARGDTDVWEYLDEQTVRVVTEENNKPLKFNFDRIFEPTCTQSELYDFAARPVVEDIFNGYNGTLFVYGQTGSGKTHTMSGPDLDDEELRGVIPRMNDTVFDAVMAAPENDEFLLHAAYVEIYMEKLRDLLAPAKKQKELNIREDKQKGIYIEGAIDAPIASPEDVLEVMKVGNAARMVASTNMNATSSRSHSLFILTVQKRDTTDNSLKTGKLYLVDLAGSEKVGKTGASGQTLEEAKQINKSLSALGNVINALTDSKAKHIPYRDSKLTRVLQESLGGNAKTTLIVNCSPARYNEQESVSTLRFGTRAKKIENKAKVNQVRSAKELEAELLKAYKEIERLKRSNDRLTSEVAVLQGMDPEEREALAAKNREVAAAAAQADALGVSSSPAETPAAAGDFPAAPAGAGVSSSLFVELEEKLRVAEEKIATLEDENESLQESMTSKDDEIMSLQSLRSDLQSAEEKLSSVEGDNEDLVLRIAKLTVDNDTMRFKIEDQDSSLKLAEEATASKAAWEEEREALQRELTRLRFEAGEDDSDDGVPAPAESSPGAEPVVGSDGTVLEDLEQETPTSNDETTASAGDAAPPATMAEIMAQNKGKSRRELLSLVAQQQKDVERLRREKTLQQQSLDEMLSEQEQRMQQVEELQGSHAATSEKLSEFDQLKKALLRDLENRVNKVVELEMLLDEAREQYGALLQQIRPAGSESVRVLQGKVAVLQKAAIAASQSQQKAIAENQQLRLDNEIYVKQLASRNERIHGLEALLHESERHANKAREEAAQARKAAEMAVSRTRGGSFLRSSIDRGGSKGNVIAPRLARPLRGGGGTTTAPQSSAPLRGGGVQRAAASTGPNAVQRSPSNSKMHGGAHCNDGKELQDDPSSRPVTPASSGDRPRQPVTPASADPVDGRSRSKTSIWDMFRQTKSPRDGTPN